MYICYIYFYRNNYLLAISLETVKRTRPFARRRARILRPFLVDILSRKPCLLTLFLLEGWNVLFIAVVYFSFYYFPKFSVQIYENILRYAIGSQTFTKGRDRVSDDESLCHVHEGDDTDAGAVGQRDLAVNDFHPVKNIVCYQQIPIEIGPIGKGGELGRSRDSA